MKKELEISGEEKRALPGFTQEDVKLVLDEATLRGFMAMDVEREGGLDTTGRAKQARLTDLADRIAAWLRAEPT